MGHDVGQKGRDHKAAQIDHGRSLSHDHEHLEGQAFGDADLGEYRADDQGSENEEHRRIHEILERICCRPDKKQGLDDPDGDTGHADGQHLENPPGPGQKKQGQGPLALLAQDKMLACRIDGIRPGGRIIHPDEQKDPCEQKNEPPPVKRCGVCD